jgi:cell division septation protein DedD
MTLKMRAWLLAAAAAGLAGAAGAGSAQPGRPAGSPNAVRTGIDAWQAGNHDEAIRLWRPLADRGDADAQFNIAQAYFLGRGVPQNNNLAEQWYERAARQGHEEAQGNLGLLMFQNGRRHQAIPWIERAAGRGDPRAQYVLGTSLFNGDIVARDAPRAYALMSRAAASGLPPAVTQLAEIERSLTPEERARGVELALTLAMAAPTSRIAEAAPPPRTQAPAPATLAQTPAPREAPRPRPRPDRPGAAAPAAAPAALASAGGRWRIQLGAFSSDAAARRAWSAVSGRLSGLQPSYVRAGAVFRLQAGPLANRAAADRACAQARVACFPVAP